MRAKERVDVVLLQLGGPDMLESVEPFLYNLFCDPDIIDLPFAFLFRKRLARLISSRRAPKVQELYRRIGGRSPILRLTLRQAAALERELAPTLGSRVHAVMRYWRPFAEETADRLAREGVRRVVLLPLYPHYSRTTTGSSEKEWHRVLEARGLTGIRSDLVPEYPDHPLYVRALAANIGVALRRVPAADRGRVHLVFSAHGTPVKLVKAGDPYRDHIVRTYTAVTAAGKWGLPHHLCFQSKVGPEKWLEPSLDQTIDRLAAEKVSHMIVVPIAFVSDHIETLSEINIEGKHRAKERGVRYFDMSPAINTNPDFIRCLAELARTAAGAA